MPPLRPSAEPVVDISDRVVVGVARTDEHLRVVLGVAGERRHANRVLIDCRKVDAEAAVEAPLRKRMQRNGSLEYSQEQQQKSTACVHVRAVCRV